MEQEKYEPKHQFSNTKYIKKFDAYFDQPLYNDIHGTNRFSIGDAVVVSSECDIEKAAGEKGQIIGKLNKDPECLCVRIGKKEYFVNKSYLTKISKNDLYEK
jgi:hypothetical protein